MLGEFWEVMLAVRWFEAAIAAAEGSREEESARVGPATVGDGFLGALPKKRRFVLNFRERPLVVVGLKSAGGVVMGCSGLGNGCDQSFAFRIRGSVSSLSLRFSSINRCTSSFMARNSDSAAIIR